MTALTLKNVNKSFGDVHVLKDINLDVEEGEFVVFVGPSGSPWSFKATRFTRT